MPEHHRQSASNQQGKEHFMRKLLILAAVAALFLAFGATRASAQGPAGNGAGAAASNSGSSSGSSRSYNPLHWMKKSKPSNDQIDSTGDRDKKLAANLQFAGVLPANASLTDACSPFVALHECLAALHASKNAGIDFNCLRANVTGVQTNADLSACKGASDKRLDLRKAIHVLKPEVDAKAQAKNAEKQAHDDLKSAA
jgi:hypothetical protein